LDKAEDPNALFTKFRASEITLLRPPTAFYQLIDIQHIYQANQEFIV
jgi:hypothetical protein